jgi:hypothetical protein
MPLVYGGRMIMTMIVVVVVVGSDPCHDGC